ncbi:hypothetical protein Tco_1377340 [Tanacetum coccineum]
MLSAKCVGSDFCEMKAKVLGEGVGITPEVPDETKDKSKEEVDLDDWGSTDDEDLILPEDKDKLKQKVDDNPWVSSDDNESEAEEDDESDAERDESDEGKNVDIGKTDEEKTKSDDDEKRSVEQPMDEQVEVPVSATQQERPTLLQSTSSHSISSNFANQFLNSPNASLVGTIPKNTEVEIISMLDVHIQQEVPVLQQEPYQSVIVSVIPESTQQP